MGGGQKEDIEGREYPRIMHSLVLKSQQSEGS